MRKRTQQFNIKKLRTEALGTEKLSKRYSKFLDWLDDSHIKLHGFRYSKKNSRYIPTQEHYVELREKGVNEIPVYKDKKTKQKITLTRGTRLHKREIELTKHDVDVLACICFYIANVESPMPYRSALFGTFNTAATTRSIGTVVVNAKSDLEKMSPGFLKNNVTSSKNRAITLLHFCLRTKENDKLHLGLPKGI